ncbi:hypothetical protein [Actinopolymorpha pittospori]|uniref:Aldouronate transport system substrate-binding protein n=1 Tax=Actinopolymorpha pittospori TaxID=648752 RepID=A0A927N1E3_9ACTN|nr:hypothetical protein [Actinopolymorpha pittospori]MBE1609158.1 putative aldouronate transport system substrate-binding protein [Actinopolymorpha pittospori]
MGLVGAAVVGACSDTGRSGGDETRKKLVLPDYAPPQELPGSIISKAEGVCPAYTQFPAKPFRSVKARPGRGGSIRALVPTWTVPPPSLAENEWAKELDRRLGVKYVPNVAVDYDAKVATTLAGGDLPDLLFAIPGGAPVVLQTLLQGGFTDLTEYLSGSNIKKYPNLELLPTYAWRSSAVENRLYGAPNTLSFINQFDIYRRDLAKNLGYTALPANGDEMFDMLTGFAKKNTGGDAWTFGSVVRGIRLAQEMFRVPTNWRSGTDGGLTYYIETDEFEAALEYANRLWDAKCYHPDALSNSDTKERELFVAGKLLIHWSSLDIYFGNGLSGIEGQMRRVVPGADPQYFLPPGHDGGKCNPTGSSPGSYGVAAIPSEIGKDKGRVEELLNIMNYWAAPFGSEEFLFLHFGIEGRHFNFNTDGQPVPVDDARVLSEMTMNVLCGPAFQYYPSHPQTAVTAQKIIARNAPLVLKDPTVGLVSRTAMRQSSALSQLVTDYTNQIVSGRKPVNAVGELRQQWRSRGGDRIRDEYQESGSRVAGTAK